MGVVFKPQQPILSYLVYLQHRHHTASPAVPKVYELNLHLPHEQSTSGDHRNTDIQPL